MKFVASLIILGFMSVVFCGLTFPNSVHSGHAMAADAAISHHVDMYENFSTATFSDAAMSFATFLSLTALAIVVVVLQLQNGNLQTDRFVLKRKRDRDPSYKFKRWITLFEHSPSFA